MTLRLEMSTEIADLGVTPARELKASNYLGLRISCWAVALILGAAQAWSSRFMMNPDGIPYIDIGEAYWRGDWRNALSTVWSPLYSWILGLFFKLLRPSPYWEYPLVHLVNFLIFVAALGAFEFFLMTFIAERRRDNSRLTASGYSGLPEGAWWLLGYNLFVSSSLILIYEAIPDFCVAALIFTVSALILKIKDGKATPKTYAVFGATLGIAYLAKAAMFPLAFVFLACAGIAGRLGKGALRNLAVAGLAFFCISGTFIAVLSVHQGRLTFSDVGPLVYEEYIDGVDTFTPTGAELKHPVRKIADTPLTYEFGSPINATYPPSYDPLYWHDGLKPKLVLKGQLRAMTQNVLMYLTILAFYSNVFLPFLLLLLISPSPRACLRRISQLWPITLPCLAALLMYLPIFTEFRYVAPFCTLLWLALFSGPYLVNSRRSHMLASFAVVAIAATTLIFQGAPSIRDFLLDQKPGLAYWQAADLLTRLGVHRGEKIAVIGTEPNGEGGAFVARLSHVELAAQSREPNAACTEDPSTCSGFLDALARFGVTAALLHGDPPPGSLIPWHRLGLTPYYAYMINPAHAESLK